MSSPGNVIFQRRRSLAKLSGVTTNEQFHDCLITDALDRYVPHARLPDSHSARR